MITGLLLLPVLAIVTWLYWFLLPGRAWKWLDSLILFVVIALAAIFVLLVERMEFLDAGPMWAEIVSVAGAYAILVSGLVAGLLIRRR